MKLKCLFAFMLTAAALILLMPAEDLQSYAAENPSKSISPVYLFMENDAAREEIIASNVSDIKDQSYTGKEICPKVNVTDCGQPLTEGTDYTCIYRNNIDVGKANITVIGIGQYTGTVTKTFNIQKGEIAVKEKGYSGQFDGKPHSLKITATPEKAEITYSTSEDGQYKSDNPERTNAGKTTVYYKVKLENYKTVKGSAEINIIKRNLENEKIEIKEDEPFTYSGAEIKPEVGISGPDAMKNCKIEYRNNLNAGTAVVEAVAKENGNYEGSVKTTFEINTLDMAKANISLMQNTVEYNGSEQRPEIDAGKLPESSFVVSYKNNRDAGTAEVTITGLPHNCKGTKTLTFTIKPADISTKTITLNPKACTYDGRVKTPLVSVEGLKGGIDYIATYTSGRKAVGTYAVTVKGNSENCIGTKKASFKINPPATKITSLTAGSKKIKIKWSKKTTQVTGYQIAYSKSSTFSACKTVKIKKYKTTSKTIKKLTAKKKYYVKIRTYKGNYYSDWSAVKAVTTKR